MSSILMIQQLYNAMVNLRGTLSNDLWNETLTEFFWVNMLEVITIKIAKKKTRLQLYPLWLSGRE